jgi:hypothetical protein
MQDLERRVIKNGTTPLRPQSDGMMEHYVKTIEKHEFYEYEVTQYDTQTGEGGNFVQFIDKFLKSKVEASGSPRWVQSPEDADKFLKYFFECKGIKRDTTIQNAAKKIQLFLNSFWGYRTELNNRPKTKMIADPQKLFRILAMPGVEVTSILFFADRRGGMGHVKYADKNMPILRYTNEVIGAYVTTGARLKLRVRTR